MKRQHSQALTDPPLDLALDQVNGGTPVKGKSRACTECQRHKIKCQFEDGQNICRRCTKQGLRCQIGNSLQKFVTDDLEWKAATAGQIARLETAVAEALRSLRLPTLQQYGENGVDAPLQHVESQAISREASPVSDDGLVPAPMRGLAEITELPRMGNRPLSEERDLIARRLLSESEAESLFDSFKFSMNQLLWGGIILKHDTMSSVRQSSSLLFTAIMTVTSLHIPGKAGTLNTCYDEFTNLVASSTLRRKCSLDDIRAMCIGAFWLPGLGWRLSGQAVRWATELGLHQSFRKLLRGENHHEMAQLWYLLYVCDHHFSIGYGRPPSIHEDVSISGYEQYLRTPRTTDIDYRLMGQVTLFTILTQVYHQFGVEDPMTESDLLLFRPYNIEIDKWRAIWQPRSANSPYLSTYPSKGVLLHHYFAKLQVNSLALRAFKGSFSVERRAAANLAISSAMSTLSLILEDQDVRHIILCAPVFTHTMISFSAMFLLKVALKTELEIDVDRVQELVERVVAFYREAVASENHLTKHIAKGLDRMLLKFKTFIPQRLTPNSGTMDQILDNTHVLLGIDQQWHDLAGTTFEYFASAWQEQPSHEVQGSFFQSPWDIEHK